MIESNRKRIWQIKAKLHKDNYKSTSDKGVGLSMIYINAGFGTFNESNKHGLKFNLINKPAETPDSLVGITSIKDFSKYDLHESDGPGLVVDKSFIKEFKDEINYSCRIYDLYIVDSYLPDLSRDELMKLARKDLFLEFISPDTIIRVDNPIFDDENDEVFIDYKGDLPPFFRVSWRRLDVFVRDDIHDRILESGIKGVEFNPYPWD